jgi:hypothetical protein
LLLDFNLPCYTLCRHEGEAIMSVLSLILQICAIDWFIVESGTLRSQGALVYPLDVAADVAEAEQASVPHLTFLIRCEEQ